MEKIVQIPLAENKKRTPGERSIYTQQLVKRMEFIEIGEILTYEEMEKLIGLDCRPDGPGYNYQVTAREIIAREYSIWIECVDRIGLKRLSPKEVAESNHDEHIKKMKSVNRKFKKRIQTIDDDYDDFDPETRRKIDLSRTVLAFEDHLFKPKSIKAISEAVNVKQNFLGFNDTIHLFGK